MIGRVTETVSGTASAAVGTASALAGKAAETVKAGVATVMPRTATECSINARNNAMVKELRDFKEHVKRLHNEVTETSVKLAGSVGVITQVMSQPLPKAYDYSTVPQAIEMVDKGTYRVGEGVDIDFLTKAPTDMLARVKKEVLVPIETWFSTVTAAEDRNLKCDALGLELDVQKKHVEAAERNAAELQSKGHKDTRTAMDQLQAEQAKEQSLHSHFVTTEAQIFNELLWCIQEAMELRRYSLVALQSLQELMAACTSAFDLQVPIHMKLPSRAEPGQAGHAMRTGMAAEPGPEPLHY